MGTAGFVALTNDNVNLDTLILGVTSDGFLDNLTLLAAEVLQEAKKARVLTKFRKGDRESVNMVLQRVSEKNDFWCFVDKFQNAEWISYSVILNTVTGKVTKYEGFLEYPVR